MLSSGHACVLQYSLLHLTGYELSLDDLRQFRQWGSRTPGHPERGHTPGIEITTGPLGQGFANAVGMAIAERFLAERFNRPGREVVDHHTYAICSDGDLMEGISQEAASIAGHFGLGKLVVCYDDNHITIDGTTAISFDGENHSQRLRGRGLARAAGDRLRGPRRAARRRSSAAREEAERPSFIAIRSHIAYPAPHAVDTAKAHGSPLGEDEVRATKEVDGLRPRPHVLGGRARVRAHVAARARRRARRRSGRSGSTLGAGPSRAGRRLGPGLGRAACATGWREALPRFEAGEEMATRAAGQKTMAAFSEFAPTMIGGAADLVESTKTVFEGAGEFSRVHAGRNVPFGIREHAMGAIVNGAARARRDRQAVRLDVPDVLRLHARVGAAVGADGAAGRVGVDARLGWPRRGRPDTPAGRALRRAARDPRAVGDPPGRRERDRASRGGWRWSARTARWRCCSPARACPCSTASEVASGASELERGGYVLWDSAAAGADGSSPELILIVDRRGGAPTLAGRHATLAAEGTRVRVVSMPCMELFEAQPHDYREQVLPPASAPPGGRAGRDQSWWRWVGDRGGVLGVDRFGASAPGRRCWKSSGSPPRTSPRARGRCSGIELMGR